MSAAAVSSARWRLSQACMSVATLLLLLLNAWMMGTRLRDVGQTQPNLTSSVSFTSGVASIVPTRWEHTMVEVAQQEQAGTHHNGQAAGLFAAAADTTPEVWARGPATAGAAQTELTELLGAKAVAELRALCGRCLYRTLTEYVRVHGLGDATIVLTGDIPAMWLRDSAVQIATYLPRLARRPSLRPIIDGAIRAQAYFVLQDPYANAFNPAYVHPTRLSKAERQLGRGGWVWTRNFELDSLAYFFNLLWNYHATPGLWRPGQLLEETIVHDAVVAALRVLEVEQHHEEQSPYRCVTNNSCYKQHGMRPTRP
jgi:Metal-independent alpha-mannosidase (GH125)